VPAVTPVTVPVALFTVTMVLPLLHTPPVVGLVSVVVVPAHSPAAPLIAPAALMLIVRVAVQPGSEPVEPIE
jgi:hypothetical protein